MNDNEWLADRFEEHRAHLRAVAYRMLGSLSEADDAVQDTWLRLSRSTSGEVENLGGWLTTVVARVCLNILRARNIRREESLGVRLPDPVISPDGDVRPEDEALLADSVGLALLVVLDTPVPGRAVGVRPARRVRAALRGDRPHARSNPRGGETTRQQGTTPREGR